MVMLFALWAANLIVGFGLMQWALQRLVSNAGADALIDQISRSCCECCRAAEVLTILETAVKREVLQQHTGGATFTACRAFPGLRLVMESTPNSFSQHPVSARNGLLEVMPPDVRAGLAPLLELVHLGLGEVLYESGVVQHHVYFPTDCIVSLLYVLESGQSAEIAVVGFEGMVGVSLLMGGGSTPNRAVVQSAGHAFRLSASHIKQLVEKGGPFLHLLLR